MRTLVIDEEARQEIANLLKYADENRISKPFLMAAMSGDVPPVGQNQSHCCYLRNGFKIVFSIEQQPKGWSKHISVSVDDAEKLPSVEAVEMIIKEFDMKPLKECMVYIEETSPKAVNVISLI